MVIEIETTMGEFTVQRASNGFLFASRHFGIGSERLLAVAETPEKLAAIVLDWAKRQEAAPDAR